MEYLKSKSFKNALRKAVGVAANPVKIADLIASVTSKMSDMDQNKERVSDFFQKVRTFLQMLRAYISGDYREIPWKSLLMIIGSLIYFMMPIDILPDFIPVLGLADDISIIFLVFKSINKDIEAFHIYENSASQT